MSLEMIHNQPNKQRGQLRRRPAASPRGLTPVGLQCDDELLVIDLIPGVVQRFQQCLLV